MKVPTRDPQVCGILITTWMQLVDFLAEVMNMLIGVACLDLADLLIKIPRATCNGNIQKDCRPPNRHSRFSSQENG